MSRVYLKYDLADLTLQAGIVQVQDVKSFPIFPTDWHFVKTTHTSHFLVVKPETQVSPFAKLMHRPRVAERVDEFECILCLKLLYQPVTTPCGHTFCRDCFLRAGDHSNKCPMCRTVSSHFILICRYDPFVELIWAVLTAVTSASVAVHSVMACYASVSCHSHV